MQEFDNAIAGNAPPSPSGTKKAPPCTLVIFGAGGDLTKRLLMPALYNLTGSQLLDDGMKILGVDAAAQSSEAWVKSLSDTMQSFTEDKSAEFYTPKIDEQAWNWATSRMKYVQGDFTKAETFQQIKNEVGDGNAIFYLAVASRFFATIVENLGQAGMLRESDRQFRRMVIEKPFGADLASARDLNARILKQADESQIYRIDHFLGKETVQSLMAVRFANGLFEPTWRRDHIDHVQITAAETVGVEQRGGFYEQTGALRDMIPNHLFTLLSMIAMEPPNSFDAEDVRAEKAKLIGAIRTIEPENAVRGQYSAGDGAKAYRQEPHVAPDSRTETYAALRVDIDNWRWAGVPFYIRTGKKLSGRLTEVDVYYKPAPYKIFRDGDNRQTSANVVRFLIDPEQGIVTEYDAKIPGPEMKLSHVESAMRYKDFFEERPNVGYETLLYDCMLGDPILFQRADAIEQSWRVVEKVQKAWAAGGEPEFYPVGSAGPAGAEAMLERDGRRWRSLNSGKA